MIPSIYGKPGTETKTTTSESVYVEKSYPGHQPHSLTGAMHPMDPLTHQVIEFADEADHNAWLADRVAQETAEHPDTIVRLVRVRNTTTTTTTTDIEVEDITPRRGA